MNSIQVSDPCKGVLLVHLYDCSSSIKQLPTSVISTCHVPRGAPPPHPPPQLHIATAAWNEVFGAYTYERYVLRMYVSNDYQGQQASVLFSERDRYRG
jgi:hypothetical protein